MPIKTRQYLVHSSNGVHAAYSGSTLVGTPGTDLSRCIAFQKTDSSNHPFYSSRNRRSLLRWQRDHGLADFGGSFYSAESTCDMGGVYVNVSTGPSTGSWYTYSGMVFAQSSNLNFTAGGLLSPSSVQVLNAFGTHAISVTIPTNPLAGMGQFLGELRDLPKVPLMGTVKGMKKSIKKFRALSRHGSDEYLNIQFGWVPFISDLKKFHKVVMSSEKRVAQFRKGSGKLIRRRFVGDEVSTTTVVPDSGFAQYGSPVQVTPLYAKVGKLSTTTTTTTKQWFSGAYTYFLPEPKGFVSRLAEAEALGSHLYGLRLTPDLLWKLAPWSWAVDWVSNAGDIVHNWSAFQNDGLVLQYGYVMETKTQNITYVLSGLTFVKMPPLNLTQTIRHSVKSRSRATPYGFGLSTSAFTLKQWSIIAALGISKAPRSLNF